MEMTHTCLFCWQVPHDKNIRIYFDQNWIRFESGLPWKSGSIRLFFLKEKSREGDQRNSEEHTISFPSTCTIYFLFIAFFLMLCKVFDFFPWKITRLLIKKKSKPSSAFPQEEIKTTKLPSSRKTSICQQFGKIFEGWKHHHLLMSFQNDLFPLSFNI